MPHYTPNKTDYTSPLPKTLVRYRDRLFSYNDERSYDNPIFVGYRPGWKSYTDFLGIQHADAELTVKEILFCVKNAIPCDCDECIAEVNASPEAALEYMRAWSALTPLELDTFEWAADPTLEMVESEDGVDERAENGDSLLKYMRHDMLYRLGEQLPDMTGDTQGTPAKERMEALRALASAQRIVERLEKIQLGDCK
jgi:hypothetical protein